MTQYLLSVPENLASCWHKIVPNTDDKTYFAACDPVGTKIGSGGATAWLIAQAPVLNGKKIIIHAGGQSRRLPSYAAVGKLLTPIPVFRWSTGQAINQTLLDIQSSLYKTLIDKTAQNQNTLIASGDILIHIPKVRLQSKAILPEHIPQADVVCLSMWVQPEQASHHGVFIVSKDSPTVLEKMLQKPSVQELEKLGTNKLFMMDIGIWILSDHALDVLMKKSGWNGKSFSKNNVPDYYDLYGKFGLAMGSHPNLLDADIQKLSTAIICLKDSNFFHYGTSAEIISSTESIQNLVTDPSNIWHKQIKTHQTLFVQNADISIHWNTEHKNIWIENSTISKNWVVHKNSIFTGIPKNNWKLCVPANICIDINPIFDAHTENSYCLRPYGFFDTFSGECSHEKTHWQGISLITWFSKRGISLEAAGITKDTDIQKAPLFPVIELTSRGDFMQGEKLLMWMFEKNPHNTSISQLWLSLPRLSAEQITAKVDISKLFAQRTAYSIESLKRLAKNPKSVFYQSNLEITAQLYAKHSLSLPPKLASDFDYISKMRDAMFRCRVQELTEKDGSKEKQRAFSILQDVICSSAQKVFPTYDIYSDQIVWGRSPLRIDLAGGWSDTPPYSNIYGGAVVNVAVDLNNHQPIQVYIRSIPEPKICLRSIDSGQSEEVLTYRDIHTYNQIGSVFSIPKAALSLCGFHPDFCTTQFASLKEQLLAMGGGLEINLLASVPKGSGLGTSSILSSAVLGTLSNVCSLGWDMHKTAQKVLILEQLLTTGGGWQDQYGAVFGGLKLLESSSGVQNDISVKWLNDNLFTKNHTTSSWLLYYTGITRVAKNILSQIVQGMFLNDNRILDNVHNIKQHAYMTVDAIQKGNFEEVSYAVHHSWILNKALDSGTTTPIIEDILLRIEDYICGAKLLGAGGGGYIVICAKDASAASKIRQILEENPPNNRARFVDMSLNTKGLEISRS